MMTCMGAGSMRVAVVRDLPGYSDVFIVWSEQGDVAAPSCIAVDRAQRTAREPERARLLLAVITMTAFAACTLLIVVGGLFGRFHSELVAGSTMALGSSAAAATWFYFKSPRIGVSPRGGLDDCH